MIKKKRNTETFTFLFGIWYLFNLSRSLGDPLSLFLVILLKHCSFSFVRSQPLAGFEFLGQNKRFPLLFLFFPLLLYYFLAKLRNEQKRADATVSTRNTEKKNGIKGSFNFFGIALHSFS